MEYLPCGREQRLNLDCASLSGVYKGNTFGEIDYYYYICTWTLLKALLKYLYINKYNW